MQGPWDRYFANNHVLVWIKDPDNKKLCRHSWGPHLLCFLKLRMNWKYPRCEYRCFWGSQSGTWQVWVDQIAFRSSLEQPHTFVTIPSHTRNESSPKAHVHDIRICCLSVIVSGRRMCIFMNMWALLKPELGFNSDSGRLHHKGKYTHAPTQPVGPATCSILPKAQSHMKHFFWDVVLSLSSITVNGSVQGRALHNIIAQQGVDWLSQIFERPKRTNWRNA